MTGKAIGTVLVYWILDLPRRLREWLHGRPDPNDTDNDGQYG